MAVENLVGSKVLTNLVAVPPIVSGVSFAGGRHRTFIETVEVSAAASASSTYHLARIPSSAVILATSKLFFDDLASSGSPTVDLGLYNISGATDITDDVDALNDGIDVTSAGSSDVLKTPVDQSTKRVYELVGSAPTSDPLVTLDLKAAILDAATNTGGTMTLMLNYVVD